MWYAKCNDDYINTQGSAFRGVTEYTTRTAAEAAMEKHQAAGCTDSPAFNRRIIHREWYAICDNEGTRSVLDRFARPWPLPNSHVAYFETKEAAESLAAQHRPNYRDLHKTSVRWRDTEIPWTEKKEVMTEKAHQNGTPEYEATVAGPDLNRMEWLEREIISRTMRYRGGCGEGQVEFLQAVFPTNEARTLAQFEAHIIEQTRQYQTSEAAGRAFLRDLKLLPNNEFSFLVKVTADSKEDAQQLLEDLPDVDEITLQKEGN